MIIQYSWQYSHDDYHSMILSLIVMTHQRLQITQEILYLGPSAPNHLFCNFLMTLFAKHSLSSESIIIIKFAFALTTLSPGVLIFSLQGLDQARMPLWTQLHVKCLKPSHVELSSAIVIVQHAYPVPIQRRALDRFFVIRCVEGGRGRAHWGPLGSLYWSVIGESFIHTMIVRQDLAHADIRYTQLHKPTSWLLRFLSFNHWMRHWVSVLQLQGCCRRFLTHQRMRLGWYASTTWHVHVVISWILTLPPVWLSLSIV